MTEAVIFVAALLTLAIAILATLYSIARNAQSQRQYHCRHRPWNFK